MDTIWTGKINLRLSGAKEIDLSPLCLEFNSRYLELCLYVNQKILLHNDAEIDDDAYD